MPKESGYVALCEYYREEQPDCIQDCACGYRRGDVVGYAPEPAFKVLHLVYEKRLWDVEKSEERKARRNSPRAVLGVENRQEAEGDCAKFVENYATGVAHFKVAFGGVANPDAYVGENQRENYVPRKSRARKKCGVEDNPRNASPRPGGVERAEPPEGRALGG